ncbi:MAG TPA: RNA polymerase sigma factor [Candidatus Limnocylindrales bacterium]|nr:RNA polymerase sigma factor [Candidatus Limnocylindrales bacterium]
MDRELLLRARAGDREAFELVVLAKGEPLFRTALAILGNEPDARDATQETFISAWRGFAGLRDLERFDAWLGRILINQCRMALRHRGRVREVPITDSTDCRADLAAGPQATDLPPVDSSSDFDAAFGRLTVDQRALLVLHHLHGYDVREIGRWLGIPSGTVKWRLSRARAALAAQLARQ